MLYVSSYDKTRDRYGVTDTDDGKVEWVTSAELFSIAKSLNMCIKGVDLGMMRIKVITPESGVGLRKGKKSIPKPIKEPVKTRMQFLEDEIGFDYVLEQHESKDFTQFVISIGGDVRTYRVYGENGDYKVYAK